MVRVSASNALSAARDCRACLGTGGATKARHSVSSSSRKPSTKSWPPSPRPFCTRLAMTARHPRAPRRAVAYWRTYWRVGQRQWSPPSPSSNAASLLAAVNRLSQRDSTLLPTPPTLGLPSISPVCQGQALAMVALLSRTDVGAFPCLYPSLIPAHLFLSVSPSPSPFVGGVFCTGSGSGANRAFRLYRAERRLPLAHYLRIPDGRRRGNARAHAPLRSSWSDRKVGWEMNQCGQKVDKS